MAEVEHFIDVSSMTSDVIARTINEDKIQILINLNGYTKVYSKFYFFSYTNTFCSVPGMQEVARHLQCN